MVKLVKQFTSGIYNLILGLLTTSKHLGRHAITIQYPKERWEIPERSRGMVVLLTDLETGKLNCTACLLCMRACPSGAIDIDSYKDENKKRQLSDFSVDFNLCCFCGLCEDTCNFAGIKLSTKYEFPEYEGGLLKYDMKKLAKQGLDVPYEKPVKKKKPVKKPAPKPDEAKAEVKPEEKPAESKAEEKPADANSDVKAEEKPAAPETEAKPPETQPEPETPKAEPAPEKTETENPPEKNEGEE
ncbi:MAG: 4Fe-4S dicluster domain-containing protein [candidate division Zixibacteria bacterium]